ncbi:hypothetical protein ASPZODRAFT_57436 [Penicilliopsis zonata CBS 506.65]|uniref:Alpha-1,2-mannosyltransferase n=1 Tax=Penicilliopsis zonata CBS 506.65 TaxID=1073090 RepID=A0A1L9STV3_9EURO|nr:hypothetical protein ASPZODRAFT_57436 [Penicilliopsis zonata CBS 506.65]OJJ50645.1 hypothetical protein ASPZODRAFT_57436 [Penicilliopsis zonata CBS 506.65]
MPFGRAGRLKVVRPALSLIFIVSLLYLYRRSAAPLTTWEATVPLQERQATLWQNLLPLLEDHAPLCSPPSRRDSSGAIPYSAIQASPRPDLIVQPEVYQQPMQEAHDGFVAAVQTSTTLKSPHIVGTSGIVSSAGKSYLPVFVASLRMLRRTGSTLPVELFVKDESEYEKKICEEVLPSLNARCLVLSDILNNQRDSSVEIAHYQIKIFAVLFSSFEKVIWIDSDCFPLHDPAELLTADPFASTGLVTFPDFWASTASPLYFNISRQELPPMSLRASSETGVFLISKRSHFRTLLLAAYYNYYGPSYYFMLLSQGAPGEGDKETFIHAASAMNEKFYTVSEPVKPIGHPKTTQDKISGSAMVQSDPVADYKLTSQNKWRVKDSSVAKAPRAFFIHAHYPKFNPAEHVFGNTWETAPTLKPDGSDGRAWIVAEETLRRFGYDAEKAYWEEIKWVSCNLEDAFESWKRKSGICARVQKYWQTVFAEPHDDDPQFTDD